MSKINRIPSVIDALGIDYQCLVEVVDEEDICVVRLLTKLIVIKPIISLDSIILPERGRDKAPITRLFITYSTSQLERRQ